MLFVLHTTLNGKLDISGIPYIALENKEISSEENLYAIQVNSLGELLKIIDTISENHYELIIGKSLNDNHPEIEYEIEIVDTPYRDG